MNDFVKTFVGIFYTNQSDILVKLNIIIDV